jgi:hypothetical protein
LTATTKKPDNNNASDLQRFFCCKETGMDFQETSSLVLLPSLRQLLHCSAISDKSAL